MILARLIKNRKGNVLALCDEGILGKRYTEGKSVLDLKKHKGFYEGEGFDAGNPKLKEMVSEADSMNAVGKESVRFLEGFGYDVSAAKTIEGIPHLHVYRI